MKVCRVIVFLLSMMLAACQQQEPAASDHSGEKGVSPNILLIVLDDLGYTDLGSFGGEIETPTMDSLAYAGLRLSNFHAGPSCAPTRAMLLTGTDHHLAGVGSQSGLETEKQAASPAYQNSLLPNVPTIAELLREQGYHTVASAKWHLGTEPGELPNARGFVRSYALMPGGAGHFDDTPLFRSYVADWREDDVRTTLPEDFYSTDTMTDKILEYLAEGRADQPFFAYLSYTAPHWPLQAPQASIDKYNGVYDAGWEVLRDARLKGAKDQGVVPATAQAVTYEPGVQAWAEQNDQQRTLEARRMQVYAAMIDDVDKAVARVLAYLADRGQLDNTLVVVMSDNGVEAHDMTQYRDNPEWLAERFDNSLQSMGSRNSYVVLGASWARAAAVPFRDSKSKVAEGGIRVPAIVRMPVTWPLAQQQVGTVDTTYMRVMDLAPTFLQMAGATPPQHMLGRSLLVRWQGGPSPYRSDEYIAGETYGRQYVRQGDWKLLKQPQPFGTGVWQLYNLAQDLGEQEDLSAEFPERTARLAEAWQDYADQVGVILPDAPIRY
ncbi:MAG: arylsulfatase [Pseudomonadota bacterium]